MAPIASLSCKETFQISHTLNSPHFSNSLNKRIYGICNNPVEHSHEYVVEVFVRGMVDSSIGTVCSLSDIKSHLRKTVANQLNGKNLNTDIDFFKFVPSTMENLAIFIWRTMKMAMDEPELLREVKLTDRDENCVVFNGHIGSNYIRGQSILTSDSE